MRQYWSVVAVVLGMLSGLGWGAASYGQTEKVVVEWRFDASTKWNGWTPNANIKDVTFDSTGVSFEAVGDDTQILSPPFEVPRADNRQWVVIELDCSAAGQGELFYTNTTEGQYGGFRPHWVAPIVIPAAGRQMVPIWPFWAGLGRIIRMRFDPPSGVHCRLNGIRIVEQARSVPPEWSYEHGDDAWQGMHAARIKRASNGLVVQALRPQAVIIRPVEPFDASRRCILRLEAECPGEDVLGLYWTSEGQPGLQGEPIPLGGTGPQIGVDVLDGAGERPGGMKLDLRQFPTWQGKVTHLAIGFGTLGTEMLTLRRLAIEENDPNQSGLRARYLGFERAINRPGRPAQLLAVLEHIGGPPVPAGRAAFTTDAQADCPKPEVDLPAINPKQQQVVTQRIIPQAAGQTTVRLVANQQTFTRTLRIDEPLEEKAVERQRPDGYDVPPPRAVQTPYQIGVYYFPGWASDQMQRWRKQEGWRERDPVLGWYAEGRPEVADWHIKWAVENGISFFIYDWYWRNGKEELGAGLNEGFLKARYRERMKFAVMWANHSPFASHSLDQLLTVTDYWIEHYFRQPNYLTVDGRPYVSFFAPGQLLTDLGSEEKVHVAFEAMRRRVREAGLPGLHIGACGGVARSHLEALKRAGFDSVTGYNYRQTGAATKQSPYRQYLLGHEALWKAAEEANVLTYLPLLTVGWDSRPWDGVNAERRFARRTQDFAEALGRLKAHLDATGRRMAILEAWNEWGEGSYIEPNVEFGFGDLEAIRATFAQPGAWPINVGPDDVGLTDPYDLRRKPGTRP